MKGRFLLILLFVGLGYAGWRLFFQSTGESGNSEEPVRSESFRSRLESEHPGGQGTLRLSRDFRAGMKTTLSHHSENPSGPSNVEALPKAEREETESFSSTDPEGISFWCRASTSEID